MQLNLMMLHFIYDFMVIWASFNALITSNIARKSRKDMFDNVMDALQVEFEGLNSFDGLLQFIRCRRSRRSPDHIIQTVGSA